MQDQNELLAMVSISQTVMQMRNIESPSLGDITRTVGELTQKLFPKWNCSDENEAILELCRRMNVVH